MSSRKLGIGAIVVIVLAMSAWWAQGQSDSPQVRTYYVAADEVIWDYAPTGQDKISGKPFSEEQKPFAEAGPWTIGHIVKKAIYREYTDASFSQLKPRPPEWEHLGMLGPLVRAVVGDTIRIVFKNITKLSLSVHPHGVFYNKDSEGAPYADQTSGNDKADDGVAPGGQHTYTWPVPERAGPSEHEPSSAFWMYHSHTEEIRDVNTGLTGPMIITRRGAARSDGKPVDVDREIIAAFMEVDENQSWYIQDNIDAYAKDPKSLNLVRGPFGDLSVMNPKVPAPLFGSYFRETINGLSFGHTPGFTMQIGERVRWYVMASTNFEIHAPHWHGNVVQAGMMRTDVIALLPMGMQVADMVPDNPGSWLIHCHVVQHMRMGMQAVYSVQPKALAAR
ncbi:MAG: multicopper oxidase domain-containing protein [Gemmatimonadota bacterium]